VVFHVTIPALLMALAVGSALIAFWAAMRFPDRAPENVGKALVHVFASFLVGWLAGDLLARLVEYGPTAAFGAIFALVLPALVYTFLAGAWFLKLAHGMFSQHRHQ
jgi:hypothetical protein